MELQQMRYVVEVAETGSFTRAAERCHVTQSALSHQIAALERTIGERLFARTSRSVRLTESGEAFVASARVALAAAEKAVEDATAIAGRVTGTLRLGVIPTVVAVDVPRVLVRFRDAHPHARVQLQVGNSDEISRAVRQGELDVGLLGLREHVEPLGVASRLLRREHLVAALPSGHPLATRPQLALSDLRDAVFADFPAGTSGRAQSDAAFAAADLPRDVAFEMDSAQHLLGLVAAGLAVSLVADAVATKVPGVVTVPVSDGPVRIEYVVWPELAARTVTRAFLAVLDEE